MSELLFLAGGVILLVCYWVWTTRKANKDRKP
jgi:hypothetical protein